MERKLVVQELSQFFDIEELVCRHVFQQFSQQGWQFFNTELLETLLIVRRDILQVPLTINNWKTTTNGFSQRGFRCNVCELVQQATKQNRLYISAHMTGAGVDFDAQGLTAKSVRDILSHHKNQLPFPIRLEEEVSWVHMDVYDYLNGEKINFFKA